MSVAARRVVIVGAGFGGLSVARSLAGRAVEVLLVDRNNYHAFQPLLYQVATATLDVGEVAHPVRGIRHIRRASNVGFRVAEVVGVDWDARVLKTDRGPIDFDYLVVAAGAVPSYYGIPGVAANSFPLKEPGDAVALRNHILARFEEADADPSVVDDGALTFAIAGGGPTGVEMAGTLVELFDVLRKDFPAVEVDRARIVLIEMSDALLGTFDRRLRNYALDVLRRRGVEVRLGEAVSSATDRTVELGGGGTIPTHTLIWTAGVEAAGLGSILGLPCGRGGRIEVAGDLSIPSRPGAYAVGDIAAARSPSGEPLPQLAPVAVQAGRYVADRIVAELEGRDLATFAYHDRGTMATIGRHAAIAEIGRWRMRGYLAWVSWALLHLLMLVGFRNRLTVLVKWVWDYWTYDKGVRLILPAPRAK